MHEAKATSKQLFEFWIPKKNKKQKQKYEPEKLNKFNCLNTISKSTFILPFYMLLKIVLNITFVLVYQTRLTAKNQKKKQQKTEAN